METGQEVLSNFTETGHMGLFLDKETGFEFDLFYGSIQYGFRHDGNPLSEIYSDNVKPIPTIFRPLISDVEQHCGLTVDMIQVDKLKTDSCIWERQHSPRLFGPRIVMLLVCVSFPGSEFADGPYVLVSWNEFDKISLNDRDLLVIYGDTRMQSPYTVTVSDQIDGDTGTCYLVTMLSILEKDVARAAEI